MDETSRLNPNFQDKSIHQTYTSWPIYPDICGCKCQDRSTGVQQAANLSALAMANTLKIRVVSSMAEVDATGWDRLANSGLAGRCSNPFVSHAFLSALEDSGSANASSGWQAQHLVLEEAGGKMLGALPCYLKSHSQGEYVFDHGWAEAFGRAGGRYYPKLQCSVPFTPATGPRLMANDNAQRHALLGGLIELNARHGRDPVALALGSLQVHRGGLEGGAEAFRELSRSELALLGGVPGRKPLRSESGKLRLGELLIPVGVSCSKKAVADQHAGAETSAPSRGTEPEATSALGLNCDPLLGGKVQADVPNLVCCVESCRVILRKPEG